MEKDFYYIELFEIYGGLLTVNQKDAFYSHYCLDLSLAEIAEDKGLGRQSVFDTIKNAKTKLDEYEKLLKLREKFNKLKKLAQSVGDEKIASEIFSVIGE